MNQFKMNEGRWIYEGELIVISSAGDSIAALRAS